MWHFYHLCDISITWTNRNEEEASGAEVEEDRTEVLPRRNQRHQATKPATEGRRIPYETEVNANQRINKSTHYPTALKTSPTLLTKRKKHFSKNMLTVTQTKKINMHTHCTEDCLMLFRWPKKMTKLDYVRRPNYIAEKCKKTEFARTFILTWLTLTKIKELKVL